MNLIFTSEQRQMGLTFSVWANDSQWTAFTLPCFFQLRWLIWHLYHSWLPEFKAWAWWKISCFWPFAISYCLTWKHVVFFSVCPPLKTAECLLVCFYFSNQSIICHCHLLCEVNEPCRPLIAAVSYQLSASFCKGNIKKRRSVFRS